VPNSLVKDPQARIVQAFRNLKLIAESEGREPQRLHAAHRLCQRSAPLRGDGRQGASWAVGRDALSSPNMVEVQRLFDDDIVEVDSVFYIPAKK